MTMETLDAALAVHAAERPEKPALICDGRRTSYADLDRESERGARALHASGLGNGARVGYLGKESEHYYELLYACARSGVVLIVVFFLSTLTSGLRGILEAKRRLRDARAWSPALAARYRAEALRARETKAAERYALLAAGIVVVAVTFAILGDAGKTPAGSKLTLVAFGLAIAAAGRLASRYGECAMPRDPDATYRSPAPLGNA